MMVGGAALLWGARVFRKHATVLYSAMSQPVRLHLEPRREGVSWNRRRKVERFRQHLEHEGFRWFADYTVREIPYMGVAAFCDRQGAVAIVYDHLWAGVAIDIVARFDDHGGLCVSNSTMAGKLSIPPWAHRCLMPRASQEEMVTRFRLEYDALSPRNWIPVTPETFADYFEASYADEMDWRNSRGRLTLDEVAACTKGRDSPQRREIIEKVWRTQHEKAIANFTLGMLERARASDPVCLNYLQASDCLVVHDGLDRSHLLGIVQEHLQKSCPGTDVSLPPEEGDGSVGEWFGRLLSGLPPELSYEPVTSLDFPVAVTVYRKCPQPHTDGVVP